jgi:hypothetical protein
MPTDDEINDAINRKIDDVLSAEAAKIFTPGAAESYSNMTTGTTSFPFADCWLKQEFTLEQMLAGMQAMQAEFDDARRKQDELLDQCQACPHCWERPHYNDNRALVLCDTWYGLLRIAFPPRPECVAPEAYLVDTLGWLPLVRVACVPPALRFDFELQSIQRNYKK